MWIPELNEVESLGWEIKAKYDFGYYFIWKSDKQYWNCPTLFIGIKEGYNPVGMMKFTGKNSWYGKMENVFLGACNNIEELKMICGMVKLDDYVKFK